MINALRGHLAEHGVVAAHLKRLADEIADAASRLPATVRELGRLHLEQIDMLGARIADLDKRLRAAAGQAETTRRLQTMPGVGPVTAVAVETFAPPMQTFRRGRGLRGLARARSGAMAVVRAAVRSGMRSGAPEGSWLARMLAKKPRMLVAIALANKMARGLWAMMTKQENYRDPAAAPA